MKLRILLAALLLAALATLAGFAPKIYFYASESSRNWEMPRESGF